MKLTTENILLIGSILLFISLLAGKTSYRFGVPVLLLFIAIGMLAGSEGIGGIYFNSPKTAQFIGIIALNFILFSGGLDTQWHFVKPVLWPGLILSTAGVLITASSVGIFVWLITDFTLYEGLLLGSIVSSTDSAAVFSVLRSKNIALKGNLRAVLELESGSNDPLAYILTITFTGLVINQGENPVGVVPVFLLQLVLGGIMGLLCGKIGKVIINDFKLEYEGLYTVLVIAIMFFSFSATDFIGGNGFLAVYLTAIIIGNQEIIHKRKILKAFDSFAWLMQIVLFLTLGLLVYPSQIIPVLGIGMVISLFLIIVARPLSIFISLIPFKFLLRKKIFLSWVGLRGAVPIVFATYPLLAGVEKANMIFNIVFFISLTSVLVQGTTLARVARWLHLTLPVRLKRRTQFDLEIPENFKSFVDEILLSEGSLAIGKFLFQLNLPKNIVITYIKRDNKYLTPSSSTLLLKNDILIILSEDHASLARLMDCLGIQSDKMDQYS